MKITPTITARLAQAEAAHARLVAAAGAHAERRRAFLNFLFDDADRRFLEIERTTR